jgi:Tfp pilus assembly protein PilF
MAAPPANWLPGTWNDPAGYFAGSPEALAADWLAAGLTGLGAQVNEPYLDGAFRPATLQEAWARGYTLAESFYLAMPYLSWQAVVFGDPLARASEALPQGSGMLTAVTDPGDQFIVRKAAVLRQGQPDLDEEAARLMARAQMSIARGDLDEATAQLERALLRAPAYLAGQLLLGQQYEASKKFDLARERYRLVLAAQPANVVALNNLAFNLGVHGGQPAEALGLAERAAALGSNFPAVLDTLGWLRHLSGDSRRALDPLRRAVELAPALCEAWTHLAEAERGAGNAAQAVEAEGRAKACAAGVNKVVRTR